MRTPVCELLRISVPIMQAPFGPWSSSELAAAVSNAGGLGSLGTSMKDARQVRAEIARTRELTARPFAVNHTARPFNAEAFAATLDAGAPLVSYALGAPGELVGRAHAAGTLFVQQVHTVEQARRAADAGVDVLIAQGCEAGGFGGEIGTLVLVPQVVEAVRPLPVLAAGGIADGRTLAATLVLGATGANVGTRFLAAAEAGIPPEWQQRVLRASAEEAVRVDFADAVFPPAGPDGYPTRPRALRTDYISTWNARAGEPTDAARDELLTGLREGRAHELVPFTGQSAELVREVLPAAQIIERLVAEAERVLRAGPDLAS